MSRRIRHITKLLLAVGLLWCATPMVWSNCEGSPTEKKIVIEFPMFNHELLSVGDSISISLTSYNSLYLCGSAVYMADSFLSIPLLGSQKFNLSEYSDLNLQYFNSIKNCTSEYYHLTVDHEMSDSNLLYISTLEITDHYFYYPHDQICNTEQYLTPITNIPEGRYNIYSDLMVDHMGNVSVDTEVTGIHTVFVETDYCLQQENDSIDLYFTSVVDNNLPDTITFCKNQQDIGVDLPSNYELFTLGGDDLDYTNSAPKSGHYLISDLNMECYSLDTVYITQIEPEPIFVSYQELCDRTVLNLDSDLESWSDVNWSNGANTPSIEVTESQTVWINAIDKNGCLSVDSVDVTFYPFEVESIQYTKEESDCWKDGRIDINAIQVNNERSGYQYDLVNTLTNETLNQLDEIPEGIYKVVVTDDRDCVTEYPEQITVLQNCLNDYPVFTPNQDGAEDKYFIPYEGTIKIYDRDGRLINKLETPAYWDGADDAGNPVPMGNYVMLTDKGKPVNITIVR